ncbi:MAG: ZIP family metal transporter [Actinomycetota bacterium]|nr:ZIP family metal transporter [Actinomycetota bacterium]
MTVVLLAFTTFGSTMLGGLFALRHQDRLHRILGFTAGVLLGVVAFDLLPEIHQLTNTTGTDFTAPMIALAAGFLLFHVAEKLTLIHACHEQEYNQDHHHPQLGVASGLALSAHSFFDGVGIGLAFQVSTTVGLAVAVAVIAHDFADGLNTVTVMLVNGNTTARSWKLLLLDATTPLLGAASTLMFTVADRDLLLYLGFFTGFLLYIGASDILPEAHANHPSGRTLLLTVAGTALIFLVTRVGL